MSVTGVGIVGAAPDEKVRDLLTQARAVAVATSSGISLWTRVADADELQPLGHEHDFEQGLARAFCLVLELGWAGRYAFADPAGSAGLSRSAPRSVGQMELHRHRALEGLTKRARYFVLAHGVKIDLPRVSRHREQWLAAGIPSAEIERATALQDRWGGLALPPSPHYDGGPRYLDIDVPEGSITEGWWFEAGIQRTAVPYSFMIGPKGEFGIHADRWTPLHETVEGWVEAVALAHHASMWAKQINKVTGDDVDALALDSFEPVEEVRGLADTWWRGADSLVSVYRGEAECLAAPQCRAALIYSGLDKWGLYGGVRDGKCQNFCESPKSAPSSASRYPFR